MNPTDAECREAFDKEYGLINQLARKPTGEYEEYNLELTWKCWEKAWQTCRAVVERVDGKKDDGGKPQHNVPWTFSASS